MPAWSFVSAVMLLSLGCGSAGPEPTPPSGALDPKVAAQPTARVVTPATPLLTQPPVDAGASTPETRTSNRTPEPTAEADVVPQTPGPGDTVTRTPSPRPTSVVVPGTTVTAAGPSPVPARVSVVERPRVGPILTDNDGRTLYLFTGDRRNISNCDGHCAEIWPPLITSADPTGVPPIEETRLRVITRRDGSTQVTYNGWPLYHFSGDSQPGDTNGQSLESAWFVVSAAGGPIQNNALVNTSVHPELGTILTEASGRTVYLFMVDERSKSNCIRGCAVAWPPLLTVGEPTAGKGVSAQFLTTIDRGDGTAQVTYNGWPLYYFAPDAKSGDANGQNVADIWFVVSAAGGPIQTGAFVSAAGHPQFGTIVTDASGRTLYLFTEDENSRSTCYEACALAWPPVLTVGAPEAGSGVAGELLGTTVRTDGSTQVTYDGQPLYYFAFDDRPGDTTGQNSGGVWFVLSPVGNAVTSEAAAARLDAGPTATPTVVPVAAEAPTSPADSTADTPIQEIATLENYRASQFFPPTLVVVQNVPVRLFMTRLHREHVNRFSIEPFLLSTAFYAPGTMGEERFTPDRSGEFKMRNEGHGFRGDFVVVETSEDARKLAIDRGVSGVLHHPRRGRRAYVAK